MSHKNDTSGSIESNILYQQNRVTNNRTEMMSQVTISAVILTAVL